MKVGKLKGERIKGVGTWFPKRAEYQSCVKTPGSLLWVTSGPGTGKTMLAMQLIEDLESGQGHRVFCVFADPAIQLTRPKIILSLLYQLLCTHVSDSSRMEMFEHILPYFRRRGALVFHDTDLLWVIFRNMLEDFSIGRVFFVLDGFDECEETTLEKVLVNLRGLLGHVDESDSSSSDSSSDNTLQDRLNSKEAASKPQSQLDVKACIPSIVLLSRAGGPSCLREQLHGYPRLCLDEDANCIENLKSDVRRFIRKRIERRGDYNAWPRETIDDVISDLEGRADGIFLWVSFVLDELIDTTAEDVRFALENFPTGLDKTYAQILRKVT